MTTSPSDSASGGRPPASEDLEAGLTTSGQPAADKIDPSLTDKDGTRGCAPDVNPWHPIVDAVDLKHLGKLMEECSELGSAVARCIIQGIYEAEPVTGKINREWLEEEIADVEANIELVKRRFGLDRKRVARRRFQKMLRLAMWHRMA